MLGGTHWIVEGRVDPRWPINTRGNVGEVFPEVLTPLTYGLGVIPAEAGWREAYKMLGILDDRDFAGTDPVIIGLYGGYAYLNLSYLRMMGVRAPGSSPEAIDVAFFGEGNPPPYQPRKGDRRPLNSLKILRSVLKGLGQRELPWVVADSRATVEAWEARRPDLAAATDDELFAYLDAYPPVLQRAFRNHMVTTALSAIVSGILSDAATAAGEPGLVVELIGASDDVVSARYSQEVWAITRQVQASPTLTAVFEGGVHGIGERLAALVPAAGDGVEEFRVAFADFIRAHGHRGPNDWELSSRTWENTPELAYAAIDCMRAATRDLGPHHSAADTERTRQLAAAKVVPVLSRIDRANFRKALQAVPWWSRAREATRDLAARVSNPTRQVFFELARRAAERGGTHELRDVAMLDARNELREYLRDPAGMVGLIEVRAALRDRFAAVTPPFFISGHEDVPSIEALEAQAVIAARSSMAVAASGTVLKGSPGSPGIAKGRVRVVHDPADPEGLQPDEILVAPLTDPSWTPLFLPAAAVVVNVGALMSHAVIVSRELGIPCVVAADGATQRLANGMLVEVDGTAGTVTVL